MSPSFERKHRVLDGINPSEWREKLLSLKKEVPILFLENGEYKSQAFHWICGVGIQEEFILRDNETSLHEFDFWLNTHPDWRFGYLSYDVKNLLEEELFSKKKDAVPCYLAHFFVPEQVFIFDGIYLHSYSLTDFDPNEWLKDISEKNLEQTILDFSPTLSKDDYIQRVNALKQHIQRGDIYEVNFCTEWLSDNEKPISGAFHNKIHQQLKAPFSGYLCLGEISMSCHSPERYLKRSGNTLLSQPIKGTSPRFSNLEEDEKSKLKLLAEKEKAENVMIVDLVRNDFSRIAQKGSVKVEELFGIYTFPQVHQLISSVSCEIDTETSFSEILKASFPMGSMTGAPKISAMNLAEQYEPMNRGLYSGSIGYFDPNGNFDFNVVIRSLIHHTDTKKIALRVGSAITWDADPEKEWIECEWKMKGLIPTIAT